MKTSRDLKTKILIALLPIAVLLNYILNNVIVKRRITVIYVSLLLLNAIHITIVSKNRPISRKDKMQLTGIISLSIFIFILVYLKII